MTDFSAARRMMVDGQVRTSDVTDLRLIAAMQDIPRERFVPDGKADLAYLDLDIAVTEAKAGAPARCLLKPMVLAKLIQAAEIGEGDHVLDVGCATGYSSAVLAKLARSVVALEQEPALARQAAALLPAIGAQRRGGRRALIDGWPELAPYDVILLNGTVDAAPKALLRQLKDGGRLVGVVGRYPSGKAMLFRSIGGEVSGRPIFDAGAPLLPGFAQAPVFVF